MIPEKSEPSEPVSVTKTTHRALVKNGLTKDIRNSKKILETLNSSREGLFLPSSFDNKKRSVSSKNDEVQIETPFQDNPIMNIINEKIIFQQGSELDDKQSLDFRIFKKSSGLNIKT